MNAKNESRLQKAAERILEIFRYSGVGAGPFVEQVSFLIYLKLLDEREQAIRAGRDHFFQLQESQEPLYSGFAEEFQWSHWEVNGKIDLQDFVADQAVDYVQTLTREAPEVARFFKDAQIHLRNRELKRLYEALDCIKFDELSSVERGDFYTELLEIIGQSREGIYRTPSHLRRLMVELIDPSDMDLVLDPACGTGGLLVDTLEHVAVQAEENPKDTVPYGDSWLQSKYDGGIQKARKENSELFVFQRPSGERLKTGNAEVHGIDVSRRMARISTLNLKIRGIKNKRIVRKNALGKSGGRDVYMENKYDIVISNPPFGKVGQGKKVRNSLLEIGREGRSRQDLLFLKLAMVSLEKGGRCVMAVPNNVLFGSTGAHQKIRHELLYKFCLDAIISLDAPVFAPHTRIPVSILVFSLPSRPELKGSKRTGDMIWFYEIKEDGYSGQRTREPDPERSDIPDLLEKWEQYKDSNFTKPPGPKSTEVLDPESSVQCWWTTTEQISKDTYDLSPSRYRPRTEKEPERPPEEIINELEDLEGEIQNDLRKLRKRLK